MKFGSIKPLQKIIASVVSLARLIEFYVPDSFRKKVKWISSLVRGEGKYHDFPIELGRCDAAFGERWSCRRSITSSA